MHAYLILAHKSFQQLATLVSLLDDERNDIYIHVDQKAVFTEKEEEAIRRSAKDSHVYFVDRVKVRWGTFSVVSAELRLLKAAVKKGYEYYHLLSGEDLPLKTQDEIHAFFNENKGKQFIQFGKEEWVSTRRYRIQYYWFFRGPAGRAKSRTEKLFNTISKALTFPQKLLGVDRTRRAGSSFVFAAGSQWFSITGEMADFVLQKEKMVQKLLKHTLCCDEVLMQTLAANSDFFSRCYRKDDRGDYHAVMRWIDWNRGNPYTWRTEDYEALIHSDYLFARKFDDKVDGEIIGRIATELKLRKGEGR